METTLICDRCGDNVTTTKRSITLPFICERCEAACEQFEQEMDQRSMLSPVEETNEPEVGPEVNSIASAFNDQNFLTALRNPGVQAELAGEGLEVDFAAVKQFYEDMAPASSLPRTACEAEFENSVARNHVLLEKLDDENCAHERYATVDNTTLLIADLEKQLADAKLMSADYFQRNKNQMETITDLQERVRNQANSLGNYQKDAARYREQFDELAELAEAGIAVGEMAVAEGRRLQGALNSAEYSNHVLSNRVSNLFSRVDFWKREAQYAWDRIREEQQVPWYVRLGQAIGWGERINGRGPGA
jgi:hypothetical protein